MAQQRQTTFPFEHINFRNKFNFLFDFSKRAAAIGIAAAATAAGAAMSTAATAKAATAATAAMANKINNFPGAQQLPNETDAEMQHTLV